MHNFTENIYYYSHICNNCVDRQLKEIGIIRRLICEIVFYGSQEIQYLIDLIKSFFINTTSCKRILQLLALKIIHCVPKYCKIPTTGVLR